MPIGTEIKVAIPVVQRVPVIACTAPPPAPTTLRIEYVKNWRSRRCTPWLMVEITSETSGTRARQNAEVTRMVANRSFAFRAPSTAPEINTMATVNKITPTTTVRPMPNEPRARKSRPVSTSAAASTVGIAQAGSLPAV
jgi:hypothetical protein